VPLSLVVLVVACEQGIEGERACEAAVLRLVDGPFQLVEAEDPGEVEQRADGRGHRYPVLGGDLVRGEDAAMDLDPAARLAVARHGDVDAAAGPAADARERRRRAVAEDRAVARRKDRGHPRAVPGQDRVADREHGAVNDVQATALEAMVDRSGAEPQLGQLRTRHDAVLAHGQARDRRVRRTSVTFAPYVGAKVNVDPHARMVAARA
jgi:hypothetical protein